MMGKKIIKSLILWIVLAAMLLLGSLSVMASDTGSVTLQFPAETAGVEITLYTVARLQDGEFIYCDEFQKSGITVENLGDAQEAEQSAEALAQYAAEQQVAGLTEKVKEDGNAVFENLSPALYLAAQTAGTEFLKVQAALITIPYKKAGMAEEIYDPVLSPKYSFPGGALIVSKKNENGDPLPNAMFALEEKRSDEKGVFYWAELETNLMSNENGQFAVNNLAMGTYRLVEKKAPEGYVPLNEPKEFTIEKAGEVQKIDGIYTAVSGDVQSLTVVNYPEITATPIPKETVTPTPKEDAPGTPGSSGGSSSGTPNTYGGSSSGSPVKTGDDTPIGMYMVLLILSIAAISVPVYSIIKRKIK